MRILHVTDTFLPTIGGIEVFVDELSARQQAHGHHTAIWTRHEVPAPGGRRSQRPVLSEPPNLAEFDVIHSHVSVWSPLALSTAHRAAINGIPTLITVHSMWDGLWPLLRPIALATDLAHLPIQWAAVSEVAADRVRRAIGPRQGVIVLPNAIDVAAWQVQHKPSPAGLRVASTMRLARRKRPMALIRALATVSARHTVSATIFGDGPQRPALERAIRSTRLDLRLAGNTCPAELRRAYADADVFVAPSNLESFGLAALEAKAAGLPVVAKAGTGIADFITDGRDGFIVRNDTELAARLDELAANPEQLLAMRRYSTEHPPGLDWEDTLQRVDHAYARAANCVAGQRRGATIAPQRLRTAVSA